MNNMNGYELYTKKPNTIHPRARVYFKTFHFDTKNKSKERLVRVYIPSTYDFDNPNKRFQCIYMLDGKNIFDDYTSFVGEWGVDETIEDMIDRHINDGFIVIGVDAPQDGFDRSLEMSPEGIEPMKQYDPGQEGYAHLLGDFIFNVVKPDIDRTFHTSDKKVGVAGSSMGGLMALFLALEYPDKVEFTLPFSPAIFLFKWVSFKSYLDRKFNKHLPKMFFYVGGQGFEAVFVKKTLKMYDYLMERGYSHDHIKLIYDSDKEHNEKAWREYFPSMLERITR